MMKYTWGFYGPFNKWDHYHSVAIMQNDQVKELIQLERLTRKKYDNRLPEKMGEALKQLENKGYDIDFANLIYGNTFAEGKVPCLINTSFNQSGEPLVHTQKDALISAKRMGLDGVVINNDFYQLRKKVKRE